jgi:hypothetical protein
MSPSNATAPVTNEWADFVLGEARVIELRLRGRRGVDEALEISLDHGSVIATLTSAHGRAASSRVLSFPEMKGLLAALRQQSRLTSHPSAVDSAALRAFVSALARLTNSPPTIPFQNAGLGSITRAPSGDIIAIFSIEPGVTGTVTDTAGTLYYVQQVSGKPAGNRRRLTIAQLRSLIAALRLYTTRSNVPVDALWSELLKDAQSQDEHLRAQGL